VTEQAAINELARVATAVSHTLAGENALIALGAICTLVVGAIESQDAAGFTPDVHALNQAAARVVGDIVVELQKVPLAPRSIQ